MHSWLLLLFIPTNASPAFIFLFFVCTYFLNRPCPYCSFLLLVLFVSSCNWSDRCFFDFSANWFQPRPPVQQQPPASTNTAADAAQLCAAGGGVACCGCGGTGVDGVIANLTQTVNGTVDAAKALAGLAGAELERATAMLSDAARRSMAGSASRQQQEWTGLGIEWLRSLLGRREWRIECMDVTICL